MLRALLVAINPIICPSWRCFYLLQVFAFFLTLVFLFESLILFKKAVKDEKSRRESAIVNNMETQTDIETSTSQL